MSGAHNAESACRHRRRDKRQEYTPATPSMAEMLDRFDSRERFHTFRYWCDRCGATLNSGRTWAM